MHDDDYEDDYDVTPHKKNDVTPVADGDYDPQEMLRKTARVQSSVVDAIGRLDIDKLASDPKLLEAAGSFLNGVNNTAVQVTRNRLVESSTNIDAMADAVVQRLQSQGMSTIRTVGDDKVRGRIPNSDEIVIDAPPPEDVRMMDRGLVQITFDEFADAQGIKVNED